LTFSLPYFFSSYSMVLMVVGPQGISLLFFPNSYSRNTLFLKRSLNWSFHLTPFSHFRTILKTFLDPNIILGLRQFWLNIISENFRVKGLLDPFSGTLQFLSNCCRPFGLRSPRCLDRRPFRWNEPLLAPFWGD